MTEKITVSSLSGKVEVSISYDGEEELLANIEAAKSLAANISQLVGKPAAKPAAKRASRQAAPKDTVPKEVEPLEAQLAKTTTPSVTLDDIRKELISMMKKGKSGEAKKIYSELGINDVNDLPKEKYDECYSAIKKINTPVAEDGDLKAMGLG